MAYTQTDIDTLEAAIASGQLKVRLADMEITYRSQTEMMQALRAMKSQVLGSAAPAPGARHQLADFTGD